MSKRLIFPAVLVIAIAMIMAGCGSGGGDGGGSDGTDGAGDAGPGSDGTASISKVEFVKQVDAVCAKGKKEVEAEFAAYLKKNKIKEIGENLESKPDAEARKAEVIETIGIPAYRRQIKEIDAMEAPSGDESMVEEFVAAVEKGIEQTEGEPQATFDGTSKAFAKSDKLAKEYGFKVCGNR